MRDLGHMIGTILIICGIVVVTMFAMMPIVYYIAQVVHFIEPYLTFWVNYWRVI